MPPPREDADQQDAQNAPGLEQSLVNSIGQRMVLCPAGTFEMGDDDVRDAPRREVTITKPFYIGAFEVTQSDIARLIGREVAAHLPRGELPAPFITWQKANEFCRKLSEQPEERAAGRVYRLPTEAEWEYACRAGQSTRFAFGDTLTPEQANFGKNVSLEELRRGAPDRMNQRRSMPPPRRGEARGGGEQGDYPEPPMPRHEGEFRPAPRGEGMPDRGGPGAGGGGGGGVRPLDAAGVFPPNDWGIHDMHGSLWEWCSDWYAPDAYKKTPAVDPTGPKNGKTHVARGGCWASPAEQCASAYRKGDATEDKMRPIYGFRIVCEVADPK